MRTGLKKGATGLQTVYDVFGVCPLGFGIVDPTAGGALVTAYLSGKDLKSLLEFFLADDPTLPGQYFPRVSGMRVRYDTSRPKYDQVTEIQRGDLESGYRKIDLASKDTPLYSVSCNIYIGKFAAAIPRLTGAKLALVPKNRAGAPLKSRAEALDDPRTSTGPYVLPPRWRSAAQRDVR
ncbi:MAG TPA: 5'-nucleotidase C-terminal domain-containing protein [Candidatus Binatia bacterium]|nr:5'-nucleotidase C-terminal domain-containing protein [Candidatus Binatia bacterium]